LQSQLQHIEKTAELLYADLDCNNVKSPHWCHECTLISWERFLFRRSL
jgi:hypothetical protein